MILKKKAESIFATCVALGYFFLLLFVTPTPIQKIYPIPKKILVLVRCVEEACEFSSV